MVAAALCGRSRGGEEVVGCGVGVETHRRRGQGSRWAPFFLSLYSAIRVAGGDVVLMFYPWYAHCAMVGEIDNAEPIHSVGQMLDIDLGCAGVC